MDHLSRYQIIEAYMMSSLSLFCVCLFVYVKFNHSWSRETYLVCLIVGWAMLELAALILFSLEHSQHTQLPEVLAGSIHIILDTMSLWGVAIIQILAIIYAFAVATRKESWLKWVAILECVEVTLIVIFAMVPEVPTPLELAYIAPFTSQAAAIGVIFFASRGIPSERVPKRTADHLWLLSFLLMLVSALVLGLSLTGDYERLMFPHWLLYMTISTVGYRLSESSDRSHRPADGDSELGLNPSRQLSLSHSLRDSSASPTLDGHQSLSSGIALPPPVATTSNDQLSFPNNK
ncbi:hypothetical protein EDB81DRAFT_933732 [Dactylonectria macrodidyma]|uniref:Uncharacterized protein n=1 Tax=Dactylonectria macrodidyma TaxID=307937 RepID=A0A9P9J3T7_9HYPO|nr:hypothetical protein EDB81DRAFT_933732 [Dactylonectria macrodidyma]